MIDYAAMCERLQDAGLGTLGKNITIDTLPISCPRGVFVRSNISGDEIDYEIPGLGRGEFHLIARSHSYEDGMTLLEKAIQALTVTKQPTTFGQMRVRYCRALTMPMCFPLSDGNLREFAVRMQICYDYSAKDSPWFEHEDENQQDGV